MITMQAEATREEPPEQDVGVRPDPCPDCQGVMLMLTDEYTCLERCICCQRSALLAWSSCQPVLHLSAQG
jgi:hypothetical protein